MKKKVSATLIGSIAFLVLLVIYATYAALAPTLSLNNLAHTANTTGSFIFTATGGNVLAMNVTQDSMAESNANNIVASASDNIVITLDTDGNEGICCEYDIVWEWQVADKVQNQYTLTQGATNEFVLAGSIASETYVNSSGSTQTITHTNPKFSSQLPNYDSNSLSTSIYSGSICNNTVALTTRARQTYNIGATFYNLNVSQDHLRGASFKGNVKVANVNCKAKRTTLSDTVLALESSNDYTSSQDKTPYRVKAERVTGTNGTQYDAGVRYEGKNPDNYVTYNNEEWRIIGVFDGADIGLESGKKYTKIARSTPLSTKMAWDNDNGSYENDWTYSTLNTYLNGEYLNSLTTEAKAQIAKFGGNNATWYLKGPTDSQFQKYYSQNWYLVERYTGKTGYRNGGSLDADETIKAAIGLMYPSDYGFAAYSSTCDNRSTNEVYNYDRGCAKVDWLLYSSGWECLISPYVSYYTDIFHVGGSSGYVGHDDASREYAVRPTLYLEADVEVTSGDGSKNLPYEIYKETIPTLTLEEDGYTFAWTPIENAVSYNIYSDGTLLTSTTDTSAEIYQEYTAAGTYEITVAGVNSSGRETYIENSIEYTVEQLEPLERQRFYDYKFFYLDSNKDVSSGTVDTGIISPSDFDNIVAVDIQSLMTDGYFITNDGFSQLATEFNEALDSNFCKKYNDYCYSVEKIEQVKSLSYSEGDSSTPNFESEIHYLTKSDTLMIDYNFTGSYNWSWAWAFKLQKKGYIDSAWYDIEIYLGADT